MKNLVLLVLLSLFFVIPCSADVNLEGFCSNDVSTNVALFNLSDKDYGWVGIKSIERNITTSSGTKETITEILKYDKNGCIKETKETTFINGDITSIVYIVYTTYTPDKVVVKQLKPNGEYKTSVGTSMPVDPCNSSVQCNVNVEITKLKYVPAQITGTRGNRKTEPAYYKPAFNGTLANISTDYDFTENYKMIAIILEK